MIEQMREQMHALMHIRTDDESDGMTIKMYSH